MKKIVLLSCVKTQRSSKSLAKDLYLSPFFKKSLAYAYKLNPDKIFILSSKYGLIELDEIIEPYDVELKSESASERQDWASKVLTALKNKTDIKHDHFVLLAINKYLEYIEYEIVNKETPMKHLSRGAKLHYLDEKLQEPG
jgi:hypothetical protein